MIAVLFWFRFVLEWALICKDRGMGSASITNSLSNGEKLICVSTYQ